MAKKRSRATARQRLPSSGSEIDSGSDGNLEGRGSGQRRRMRRRRRRVTSRRGDDDNLDDDDDEQEEDEKDIRKFNHLYTAGRHHGI